MSFGFRRKNSFKKKKNQLTERALAERHRLHQRHGRQRHPVRDVPDRPDPRSSRPREGVDFNGAGLGFELHARLLQSQIVGVGPAAGAEHHEGGPFDDPGAAVRVGVVDIDQRAEGGLVAGSGWRVSGGLDQPERERESFFFVVENFEGLRFRRFLVPPKALETALRAREKHWKKKKRSLPPYLVGLVPAIICTPRPRMHSATCARHSPSKHAKGKSFL